MTVTQMSSKVCWGSGRSVDVVCPSSENSRRPRDTFFSCVFVCYDDVGRVKIFHGTSSSLYCYSQHQHNNIYVRQDLSINNNSWNLENLSLFNTILLLLLDRLAHDDAHANQL